MVQIQQLFYRVQGDVRVTLTNGKEWFVTVEDWQKLAISQETPLAEPSYQQLKEAAWFYQIYQKSLELLKRREHSCQELRQKLRQRFPHAGLIERCLEEIQAKGFQSEERFAKMFLQSRLAAKQCGPYLLLAELREKGIAHQLGKQVLSELADEAIWIEKAQNYVERVLCYRQAKSINLWKKLYQRGFPQEIIEKVLAQRSTEIFC